METKESATQGNPPGRMVLLSRINNRAFIEFLKIQKGDTLCDFGCGPGLLINDLDHLFDLPEIAGVEPDMELYREAVENNLQNKNVHMIPTELPATGLDEDKYDLVYCRSFLERVRDPIGVIAEMLRVCSPGGRLFAQEGDISSFQLDPDVPGLEELKSAYARQVEAEKRDPHVGRRLYDLFAKAGVLHLQVSYTPEVHIDTHPANFRQTLQYFRSLFDEIPASARTETIKAALCEIDKRIEEPCGTIHYHWNRIEGWKR